MEDDWERWRRGALLVVFLNSFKNTDLINSKKIVILKFLHKKH